MKKDENGQQSQDAIPTEIVTCEICAKEFDRSNLAELSGTSMTRA